MTDTITCSNCNKSYSAKMQQCPFCNFENKREDIYDRALCPRCRCELENHNYHGNELDMCPMCSGLWLDNREFRKMTSRREVYKDDSLPYEFIRKPLTHENKYLKCPLCEILMVRRNFSKISGVLIDICRYHGVWLDAGELQQIRCFIINGGLDKYHDKEIIMNSEAIKSLDTRVSDLEFMQKLLHHWKFKRWIFS